MANDWYDESALDRFSQIFSPTPANALMGPLGEAAVKFGKSLGDVRIPGVSPAAYKLGDKMGSGPPMEYNRDTGERRPKQYFKGLPATTLAQVKDAKLAKSKERPWSPDKDMSPEALYRELDKVYGTGRSSGSGGSGNDSWDKRLDLLTSKLGLKTDENTPFIIRGSTMTPQYPMGSIANQVGPENAAKMLMSIMTGTSHEIPATMHGRASLGTLGLESQLMPGRLKTQESQNKLLEKEMKSTHLSDESPMLSKSSSIRSPAMPASSTIPTDFNDPRFRRADKETREQHLRRLLDEGY